MIKKLPAYLMGSTSDWFAQDNTVNSIGTNSSELSTRSLPLYGSITTRVTDLYNHELGTLRVKTLASTHSTNQFELSYFG